MVYIISILGNLLRLFVAYYVKRLGNVYMKVILKVDMAQVCNLPTQKAEAGGSPQVHG